MLAGLGIVTDLAILHPLLDFIGFHSYEDNSTIYVKFAIYFPALYVVYRTLKGELGSLLLGGFAAAGGFTIYLIYLTNGSAGWLTYTWVTFAHAFMIWIAAEIEIIGVHYILKR